MTAADDSVATFLPRTGPLDGRTFSGLPLSGAFDSLGGCFEFSWSQTEWAVKSRWRWAQVQLWRRSTRVVTRISSGLSMTRTVSSVNGDRASSSTPSRG